MESHTTSPTKKSVARRTSRRTAVVAVALTAALAAAACSDSDTAPRAIVGPEALSLQISVSPTGVVSAQTVTFRATARNQGGDLVVARFAAPACGLQIVIETVAGQPFSTSGQGCSASNGVATDTLAPGENVTLENGIGHIPAGSYRVYAKFLAANGQAPNSDMATLVVQP